jgi:hypothetical protein
MTQNGGLSDLSDPRLLEEVGDLDPIESLKINVADCRMRGCDILKRSRNNLHLYSKRKATSNMTATSSVEHLYKFEEYLTYDDGTNNRYEWSL